MAKIAVLDVLPAGNPAGSEQNYGEGDVAESVTTVAAAGEILRRDASRDGSDSRARFIGMGKKMTDVINGIFGKSEM